ncbi:hypothetical protein ABEW05_005078 [Botrytis cinerea]
MSVYQEEVEEVEKVEEEAEEAESFDMNADMPLKRGSFERDQGYVRRLDAAAANWKAGHGGQSGQKQE